MSSSCLYNNIPDPEVLDGNSTISNFYLTNDLHITSLVKQHFLIFIMIEYYAMSVSFFSLNTVTVNA